MNWLMGIAGALLGGIAGYFVFHWLIGQGVYAMVLPGALVGLGCGGFSRQYSVSLGIFAGVAALLLGLLAEWRFLPFVDDDSLLFFMKNIHQLPPFHLIMLALGGFFGFWFGRGKPEDLTSKPRSEQKLD